MKRTIIITIVAVVSGLLGFVLAAIILSFSSKTTLAEYNSMASDNFKTALLLFQDGYSKKSLVILGEREDQNDFTIGDYRFRVYPQRKTISDNSKKSFDSSIGNTAAHMNGMVIMLACRWIKDGDPLGEQLFNELQKHIPNFETSAPGISSTRLKDLKTKPKLMDSEADQWQWRMKP
jgi:phosphate/sulfate permease